MAQRVMRHITAVNPSWKRGLEKCKQKQKGRGRKRKWQVIQVVPGSHSYSQAEVKKVML